MTVRLPLSRFQAIFVFFTFFSISLVFMVRFPNFFQLYISKLNFLSFKENNYDGQTPFKQVLGYFCILHIFLHIFGVLWSDFQNFFSFKYQNEISCRSKKTTMKARLPFCRFLAIFKFSPYFSIYLVYIVRFSKFFKLRI